MTLQEIVRATLGLLVIGDPRMNVGEGVSTDSRTLKRGDIFFALKGEKFDGHRYLDDVLKKGASLCVLSQIPGDLVISPSRLSALVKVRDTKRSLGDLAKFYRVKYGEKIKRVAIAGSSGKTTVKDMIAQILGRSAPTVYSLGNFNNEIGCPISVLRLDPSHVYGVFEIGASARGEVQRLSEIVSPRVAVITNIGLEHTETFGTLENIAEGEMEILSAIEEGGTAVLPAEDAFFDLMKKRLPEKVRVSSFGLTPKADVYAEDISTWPGPTQFTLVHKTGGVPEKIPCKLPVPGRFNVLNAASASAAALALGIPGNVISEALSEFKPSPMRFEVISLRGDVTLVNDSYNANPGSARSSMEGFVESFSAKRLGLVLGDMLELGEISSREHENLGKFLAGFPFTSVFLFGAQSKFTLQGAKKALVDPKAVTHCPDKDALLGEIEKFLQPGTAVLFKASRGMRLEEIIKKIIERRS